ncbi:hypothetical protein PI124_g8045 [Phytophthora idaei]|nr:hypothetical protein PI125_g9511 [Phytophthora idaei]KAG3135673.1 hypothetical protein PI126_g18147 [Phytophthora idaei]KAG3247238.1 hypothetical protein PI124_g8045 [Phytophthora idaei]
MTVNGEDFGASACRSCGQCINVEWVTFGTLDLAGGIVATEGEVFVFCRVRYGLLVPSDLQTAHLSQILIAQHPRASGAAVRAYAAERCRAYLFSLDAYDVWRRPSWWRW